MRGAARRLRLEALALSGTAVLLAACAGTDPWDAIERPAVSGEVREGPSRAGNAAAAAGNAPREEIAAIAGERLGPADPLFSERAQGEVLVRVAGAEIGAEDLIDAFFFFQRGQTQEMLRKVVEDRMVLAEARRLGVEVPSAIVQSEVARLMDKLEEDVRRESGGAVDLQSYLREALFVEPERYRRALERYVALGMLRDRVIAYSALSETRLLLRGITVGDERVARRVHADLLAGADFDVLARQVSIQPAREKGGRWPEMPLDDPHPVVRAVLAACEKEGAPPKGFLPPIREVQRGRVFFHVVELLERREGRPGSYAELAGEIESGLKERKIDRDQYLVWVRAVSRRYPAERP